LNRSRRPARSIALAAAIPDASMIHAPALMPSPAATARS
jgi:hypothetical protein